MNTISAKELRTNLKEIVKDVGERNIEYILIYRSQPILKLTPLTEAETKIPELDRILKKTEGLGTAKDDSHYSKDKKVLYKRLTKKYGI